MKRAFRVGLLMTAFVSAGVAAACVGDEPSTSGGSNDDSGSDAASGDGSPTSDGAVGAPVAQAADVNVYVGQSAKLDGSKSTPSTATFAWSVTSVPSGSHVVTATLLDPTSAQTSFVPDVAGDYALKLTVTANGTSSSANVTVDAFIGKAFFAHAAVGGGFQSTLLFEQIDGTGQAPISCQSAAQTQEIIGDFAVAFVAAQGPGIDWIEGDAGDDPRVAFAFADALPDGGEMSYLAVGDSSSRCTGTPVSKLDPMFGPPGTTNTPAAVRLSPNGDRVAYIRTVTTPGFPLQEFVTIGIDGNNLHTFAPAFDDDGGNDSLRGYIPPRWVDETHVAWVEQEADAVTWDLKEADDSASPTVTTYMTCSSAFNFVASSMLEFDLLPDGSVLTASHPNTIDAGSANQNLVVFKPDGSHQCQLVRTLTSLNASGSLATDFALSPDKTTVAFVMTDGVSPAALYTMPVDGSAAPTQLATIASVSHGPRWAAGGAALVWTETTAVSDGGLLYGVSAIPVSGGTKVPLATGANADDGYVSSGNSL